MMLTFQGPAVKITENHLGVAFVKISQQVAIHLRGPGRAQVVLPEGLRIGQPGDSAAATLQSEPATG